MDDDVRADLVRLLAWWNAERGAPADAGQEEFLARVETIFQERAIRPVGRAIIAALSVALF
jgi:hypothetical protein